MDAVRVNDEVRYQEGAQLESRILIIRRFVGALLPRPTARTARLQFLGLRT
jgi:hypothetical protein